MLFLVTEGVLVNALLINYEDQTPEKRPARIQNWKPRAQRENADAQLAFSSVFYLVKAFSA